MTKVILGTDTYNGNYAFSPSTNQIYFINTPNFNLEDIYLITDVTAGVIIYNFSDPSLGGSLNSSNDVLTLNYNCSSLNPIDRLQIIIEAAIKPDNSGAVLPLSDDDSFIDPNDQIPNSITPFIKGQQPTSLAMPVALANEQFYDLFIAPITFYAPIINSILLYQDCMQYRSIALQVNTNAGVSAGKINFEGSNDNITWTSVTMYDTTAAYPNGSTNITLSANNNLFFTSSLSYRYFRIRTNPAVTGGSVTITAIFRMSQWVVPPFSGVNQLNVSQINGFTTQIAGSSVGALAVGGNVNVGSAQTLYPLVVGGVDSGALTRRLLTDTLGGLEVSGIDYTGVFRRVLTDPNGIVEVSGPDAIKYNNVNSLKVREADGDSTRLTSSELLENILYELKLQSYYLRELPTLLNLPNIGFKEEITDFVNSSDKNSMGY